MKIRTRHAGFIFVVAYLTLFTSVEAFGGIYPEKSLEQFQPVLLVIAGGGLTIKTLQMFKAGKLQGLASLLPQILKTFKEITQESEKQETERKSQKQKDMDEFDRQHPQQFQSKKPNY